MVKKSVLFVMVGLVVQDGHGPVDLFGEDEAYHLMGERHARKGNLFRRGGVDTRREAIGAAHHENEPFQSRCHLLSHP